MHDRTRRYLLRAAAAAAIAASLPAAARSSRSDLAASLLALERRSGGRLGVAAVDTASGRRAGHREDERFGLNSTFKLLLAAMILREADGGRIDLDEVLAYGADDIVPHAPVTSRHLDAGGMTVASLAEAAQRTSDNVAANLLVQRLGGPAAFTAMLRDLGDPVTRIDRLEPDMNFVPAGEERDTTTPSAMAAIVARLFTTDLLADASRERLRDWMIATQTGLRRLRAGLPADWVAGDKTGTGIAAGMPNKHNDVLVAWPPGRAPIVVAAYYESPVSDVDMRAEDDAVLAAAGQEVVGWRTPR
jgi:beta-lactamase class A